MNVQVTPVKGDFVARIEGVDLRGELTEAEFGQIKDAFNRYAILVFPGQLISDEQQVAFSRRFGPLEEVVSVYPGHQKHRLSKNVCDISNLDENGKVWNERNEKRFFNLANQLWHTDSSFKKIPALCSLLSARSIPPSGGETEFADLRAAYDALPDAKKYELEGLRAEHSIMHSRSQVGYADFQPELYAHLPGTEQMLVRRHPESGRTSLYLASHASHIVDWPEQAGRKLIADLLEFATQPRFVYQHHWTVGDLVMWDNRCTMHRARPYEDLVQKRDMHRTTVSEHANTVEQDRSSRTAIA